MNAEDIHPVIQHLRETTARWGLPVVEQVASEGSDPFRILIATLLSLRTKDETLSQVLPTLFALADTPEAMLQLPTKALEQAIYPVGFYRQKARTLQRICHLLLETHDGRVPDSAKALQALPGVGLKTANLVLSIAFGQAAICVDTHVHRIVNRWGYVKTKTAEETEAALRRKLPHQYWAEINRHLVLFGQNLCRPVSPYCSRCPLSGYYCGRVGVRQSR